MSDFIPAAEYLRMSTEHQQYSMENQHAAVAEFAAKSGYTIVQSYFDPATSGLTLKRRPGLRRLLADVSSGNVPYKVVLVFDISRWGRFQDVDESAHYEFVCRASGVPVKYCAEWCPEEDTQAYALIKTLKRVMAAEYSCDLSRRIIKGKRTGVELGHHTGGIVPYGLRRVLVGADGKRSPMKDGEWKGLVTDYEMLVPGPKREIEVVRRVFRMVAKQKMRPPAIARVLNAEGVPFRPGKQWNTWSIKTMLHNQKYIGRMTFGMTSLRMGKGRIWNPEEQWAVCEKAIKAIINRRTFETVDRLLKQDIREIDEDRLFETLRRLHKRDGKLTFNGVIRYGHGLRYACYKTFSSLAEMHSRLGLEMAPVEVFRIARRRQTEELRSRIVLEITTMYGDRIKSVRSPGCHRALLKLDNSTTIRVKVCPWVWTKGEKRERRWLLNPWKDCTDCLTLACLLDKRRTGIERYLLLDDVPQTRICSFRKKDKMYKDAKQFQHLNQLPSLVTCA